MEQKKPARVDNVHLNPHWREIYISASPDTVSELDVPLLDGNEVVGVLNFESTKEGAFDQEDEDFLITLAGQAVLAVKNAQAYEHEKRLAAEAQVLNEISKELTSQLDPAKVFDLILEKALELTRSTLGTLHLYDPIQNDFWMVAERGVTEDKKGARQRLDQGVVGYAARSKQLLNVADIFQPPWQEIYVEFIPRVRSEIAVPMLAGNDLRGVLNVESPVPNNFNESDERLLQGLADMAVVALQNAQAYEQAKRDVERFELLYQAGQELGKINEFEQLELIYDIILHIAEKYRNGSAVIRRYEEETQELVAIAVLNDQYSSPRVTLHSGLNGQVARERHTIVLNDTNDLPLDMVPATISGQEIRSLVITPIMFKGGYYGNLELSHEEMGRFRDADVHFLEGLTLQLASTIYRLETAQERQEFEQRTYAYLL